jgi:CBS domain containing-hemolysin-like protein
MTRVGRIPVVADRFTEGGFEFEVTEMDGKRVGKVLVRPPGTAALTTRTAGPPTP